MSFVVAVECVINCMYFIAHSPALVYMTSKITFSYTRYCGFRISAMLGFIGAGRMTTAMVKGFVNAGRCVKKCVVNINIEDSFFDNYWALVPVLLITEMG